ncbi:MAG: serine O-acetyltransferase EpsC [Phycisphaerales bacterium]
MSHVWDEFRESLVQSLADAIDRDPWPAGAADPPHREVIATILARLRALLFPRAISPMPRGRVELERYLDEQTTAVRVELLREVSCAFAGAGVSGAADAMSESAVEGLFRQLPAIRATLVDDAQAAYDGDPAARSVSEVLLCYPGFHAMLIHRVSHALHELGVPIVPRMMNEHAHASTGIDIHPGARIGRGFFIDHGTGVVIGETSEIGEFCKVYQGVTLGAKSFERDDTGRIRKGYKRHPTLQDHVTVYAGATILGGDTVIGRGSVIAGGVFVTQSVPSNHVVAQPRAELRVREQRGI